MDELSLVASVNTFFIICDKIVIIEAWDKIGSVDVGMDVDMHVDVNDWIVVFM